MSFKGNLSALSCCAAFVAFAATTNAAELTFGTAEPVQILGYSDHAMEPFITRDGKYLFFNNSNAAPDTNLHYAEQTDDLHFQYLGEVQGVNTASLEGVPSMDTVGKFYYTETMSYFTDFITLYGGVFSNSAVSGAHPIGQNLTLHQPGILDMDAQVSADGNTLYFARATFSSGLGASPTQSDLWVAHKVNGEFFVADNSAVLMQNINTGALEYGAASSNNDLELYFTRATAGTGFQTFVAERSSKSDPFGLPQLIPQISGYSEAPTISGDGKRLYFHKQVDGLFRIYSLQIFRTGVADADQDGLLDIDEQRDLDPKAPGIQNPFHSGNPDITGDNFSVGPDGIFDGANDWDGDGLSNATEFQHCTNPLDPEKKVSLAWWPLTLVLGATYVLKSRSRGRNLCAR